MSVCVVDVDKGNNEGVCDDVMEKIVTDIIKDDKKNHFCLLIPYRRYYTQMED
jgi:hypothetical protein